MNDNIIHSNNFVRYENFHLSSTISVAHQDSSIFPEYQPLLTRLSSLPSSSRRRKVWMASFFVARKYIFSHTLTIMLMIMHAHAFHFSCLWGRVLGLFAALRKRQENTLWWDFIICIFFVYSFIHSLFLLFLGMATGFRWVVLFCEYTLTHIKVLKLFPYITMRAENHNQLCTRIVE